MDIDVKQRETNGSPPAPPENQSETQTEDIPIDAPILSLRERVQKAKKKRRLKLEVPGVEGVHVLYRPIGSAEMKTFTMNRQREAAGRDEFDDKTDPDLLIDCDTLIAACLGVFTHDGHKLVSGEAWLEEVRDDKGGLTEYVIHGIPVTFRDRDLQAELVEEHPTAVRAVRELYTTDGDIVAASRQVFDFSGFAGDALRDFLRGN